MLEWKLCCIRMQGQFREMKQDMYVELDYV